MSPNFQGIRRSAGSVVVPATAVGVGIFFAVVVWFLHRTVSYLDFDVTIWATFPTAVVAFAAAYLALARLRIIRQIIFLLIVGIVCVWGLAAYERTRSKHVCSTKYGLFLVTDVFAQDDGQRRVINDRIRHDCRQALELGGYQSDKIYDHASLAAAGDRLRNDWLLLAALSAAEAGAMTSVVRAAIRSRPANRRAFISHSTVDDWYVQEMTQYLRKLGFGDVFVDGHSIAPDELFWERVEAEIQQCDAFVVVLSQASVGSYWVDREVQFARNEGKSVIPIRIDDCNLPASFDGRDVVELRQVRGR
jgi:hypothetical protein